MDDTSENVVQERLGAERDGEQFAPDSDLDEPVEIASEEELAAENIEEETDSLFTIDDWKRSQRIFSTYVGDRMQRAERANQAEFSGDLGGPVHSGIGDMHIHQHYKADSRVAMGVAERISIDLMKLRAVYVKPSMYSQLSDILEDKHIVILLSQARTGKLATALHLLQALHVDNIYQFNPNIDLEVLDLPEKDRQHGYIRHYRKVIGLNGQ